MSVNSVNQTDGSLAPIAGATIYADEPIGAILPFGGSTVPNGFLLCNGAAVSRTTYAALFGVIGTSFGAGDSSTTFNLPDLRESVPKGAGLTSKSSNHVDADGLAVGEFLDDRIQNITGTLSPLYPSETASDMNYSGTGAIASVNNAGNVGLPSSTGSYSRWEGFTFDASKVARTGATTEVKSVGVNFIIKATTISLPSDFEAAVDEKIDDALERKYVVAAGTYASGLLLEKSGHVVCAEFDGLSAAAIIEGTIPEGYRPVRNVLTMGVIVADGKSYSCWVWFFTNGTIAGAYAPENASPVDFTSARTSWSVHGSASWIVP